VGGSGGSGGTSSNVKLKYKVDVDYINNADKTDTQSYGSNSKNNRILIKSGTYATVTITLQKCIPNVMYNVKINYGE
jgi:hypothetical protein